jgi:hypothetical protein
MRKPILLLATLLLCQNICRAQYVNIPDSYFRQFLIDNYPGCMNASGMLDTTCPAVVNEKRLSLGLPIN